MSRLRTGWLVWFSNSAVEFVELYDPRITSINNYRGGPYQQALSGITNINNDWYDGKKYQIYAFEYTPGATGDITWFVGQDKTWKLDARAIGPNGNIGQRLIPHEPMALVMNLGVSPTFAPLNLTGLTPLLPVTMRFDYVRIYQDPAKKSVTCDPPGMETTPYIRKHRKPYSNPNVTTWYVVQSPWILCFG
jgi:beta-glucanase (GH16 family)